jgi:hypothetical protein
MKVAAFVFVLAGIFYLAWDLVLVFSVGFGFGAVLMGLVAGALLGQGYMLHRSKPRSRVYGLISSGALFVCFLAMAALLVESVATMPLSQWPRQSLSTLSILIGVATAFGLAFTCLLVDKRAT